MSKKYIFLFIFTSLIFLAGCANTNISTSGINTNTNKNTNLNTNTVAQNSQTNTSTTTATAQNTNQTTNNTVVVDPNSLEYKSLHNTKYGFTAFYTVSAVDCLNEIFCGDFSEFPAELLSSFVSLETHGASYDSGFDLHLIENGTNLSGADVGKYYLDLNMQYEQGAKENYTDAKYSTFAGQKSFEFIAHTGLEERGTKIGRTEDKERLLLLDKDNVFKENFGHTFVEPSKVIYFEKDGVLYRIYYTISDPAANKLAEKFRFNETAKL